MKNIILVLFLVRSFFHYGNGGLNEIVFKQSSIKKEIQYIDSVYIQNIDTDTSAVSNLCLYDKSGVHIIYTMSTIDGSSIDFVMRKKKNGVKIFDCFAIYDATADGKQFLFFNYTNKEAYIMYACVSEFYPIMDSVDFDKKSVLLINENCDDTKTDTIEIGDNQRYVPYNRKNKFAKARLAILGKLRNKDLFSNRRSYPLKSGYELCSEIMNDSILQYVLLKENEEKIISSTPYYGELNDKFRLHYANVDFDDYVVLTGSEGNYNRKVYLFSKETGKNIFKDKCYMEVNYDMDENLILCFNADEGENPIGNLTLFDLKNRTAREIDVQLFAKGQQLSNYYYTGFSILNANNTYVTIAYNDEDTITFKRVTPAEHPGAGPDKSCLSVTLRDSSKR